MLIGVIAVILSLGALAVALAAHFLPQRTLRKAFRALERDVDDMWEKVESHLGRVSRLKRSMIAEGHKAGDVAASDGGSTSIQMPRPQPQTRSSLIARYRMIHR